MQWLKYKSQNAKWNVTDRQLKIFFNQTTYYVVLQVGLFSRKQ